MVVASFLLELSVVDTKEGLIVGMKGFLSKEAVRDLARLEVLRLLVRLHELQAPPWGQKSKKRENERGKQWPTMTQVPYLARTQRGYDGYSRHQR